jgi:thiamine kinase-like enzyme
MIILDEIKEIIQKELYNKKITNIIKMNNGHINQVYKVEFNNNKSIIIKFFNKEFNLLVDNNVLMNVYSLFNNQQLGPKLITINKKYSIEEFLEGTVIKKIEYKKRIPEIIKILKKIHNINYKNILENKVNFFDSISLINNNFEIDFQDDLFKWKNMIEKYDKKNKLFDLVLSHQDLYWGNIIDTNQGLRIIDYEFCGISYRAVDIAFIIFIESVNEMSDIDYYKKIRDTIMNLYYDKVDSNDIIIINIFVMLLYLKNILVLNRISNYGDIKFYNEYIIKRIQNYKYYKKMLEFIS